MIENIYTNKNWLFDSILDVQLKKESCEIDGEKYSYRCEIASLDRVYKKTKKVFIHNIFKQQINKISNNENEIKSIYFGKIRGNDIVGVNINH
jgi:hypothetical protein